MGQFKKCNMNKKIIVFLLFMVSLLMVLMLDVSKACADTYTTPDGIEYIHRNGYSIIIGYSGNKSSVYIPEIIDGYKVVTIDAYAFKGCSILTDISLPDSVNYIGEHAFENCSNLKNIKTNNYLSIGDYAFKGCSRLTSIPKINWFGEHAFEDCEGLNEIEIYNKYNIPKYAFKGCKGLKSIVINSGVNGLTIEEHAFEECISVKNVDIVVGSRCEIKSYAFSGCISLTDLTIPDKVYEIGEYAFSNCIELKNISSLGTVKEIKNCTFYGCSKLTTITIPKYVNKINLSAFDMCFELEQIIVDSNNKDFDSRERCNGIIETKTNTLIKGCKNTTIPNSVEKIGKYAFADCIGLKNITISDSVIDIDSYAFKGCNGLTNITISNNLASIKTHVFDGCSKLKTIMLPEGVKNIEREAFRDTGIISITLPKSITSVNGYAFYGCNTLQSLTILGKSTSIGDNAFYECNSLKNVMIKGNVTSIGYSAFGGCYELNSFLIPGSVESICNYAFYECRKLTNITIPKSLTFISASAFSGCSGLENISVDLNNKTYDSRCNCNAIIESKSNTIIVGCKNTVIPENVTSIGPIAFKGCKNLKSIEFPRSVTSIGNEAFYGCKGLVSVTLPENITSIGDGAFALSVEYYGYDTIYKINNCIIFKAIKNSMADLWLKLNGYTKIEYLLSDSIGTSLSIGKFEYMITKQGIETRSGIIAPEVEFIKPDNKNLKKIIIPESITVNNVVYKVTSIKANAFKNNKKLKSIVIGANISTIEKNAFYGCKKLKKVIFKTKILTKVGKKAFKGTYKRIKFKCPKNKLKKYKKMIKKSGAHKKAIYIK